MGFNKNGKHQNFTSGDINKKVTRSPVNTFGTVVFLANAYDKYAFPPNRTILREN